MRSRGFWLVVGISLLGWGLLIVGHGLGWLGADVDRGAGFCETGSTWIRQPVNTASNLGFTAVGLLIAWQAARRSTTSSFDKTYAALVALLGPASGAMHATESAVGGHLDTLAMYLFAGFTATHAAHRWWGLSSQTSVMTFVLLVLGCELTAWMVGPLPVVQHAGNVAFGVLLLSTLILEMWIARREQLRVGWGVAAALTLAAAFAIWLPSQSGGALCQPNSLLQGHGIWHLLCAVAAWCLYRYYDQPPRTNDPEP